MAPPDRPRLRWLPARAPLHARPGPEMARQASRWQPLPSERASSSIRRRLPRPLRLRRFHPPRQIIGKSRERVRQRLAAVAGRLACRPTSVCEIGPTPIVDEITTMPISESVPCHAVAARAPRETAGRIAGDGGGAPEPLLEKMVGEVFQAGLHAPIIFAGDEDKAVGVADLCRRVLPAPPAPGLSDVPCTSGPASAGRPPWRRSARHRRRGSRRPSTTNCARRIPMRSER